MLVAIALVLFPFLFHEDVPVEDLHGSDPNSFSAVLAGFLLEASEQLTDNYTEEKTQSTTVAILLKLNISQSHEIDLSHQNQELFLLVPVPPTSVATCFGSVLLSIVLFSVYSVFPSQSFFTVHRMTSAQLNVDGWISGYVEKYWEDLQCIDFIARLRGESLAKESTSLLHSVWVDLSVLMQ